MCGIGGIAGDPGGLDGAALLLARRHRGPDRQAEAALPGAWLCAARLAISDPTRAGDQPMASEDGAVTVVHNGEVYNAEALREALAGRGHRFRSRCDTEVILRGYRQFGEAVVEHLEGMFAFAIWDAPARRLTLARDPLGIKPLWIARRPGRLAFASEVRALAAAGAVGRAIAPEAVTTFLARGSVAEPAAILRGAEALPPGCVLTWSEGRERVRRYWSLPEAGEAEGGDEAEAVRARLEESVAGCLTADVPVALLLSGGIDSAALALVARRRPIASFHVRVGGAEARRAAELARSLGFAHREVEAAPAAADALTALSAQDQPSIDGVNTFLVARAIREAGLKVAVSGLGADELFLGYPLHRHYVRARAAQRWAGPIGAAVGYAAGALLMAPLPAAAPWRAEKLLALAAARGAGATYAAARALFPPASRARLGPGLPATERIEAPEDGSNAADEVSRLELSGYLVDTLLRDADVMGMAHGVELRVPMLDRRLVERVVAARASRKLMRGRQKPLLVDAVPELPRDLVDAPKSGFDLPLERWLTGPLRGAVEAALRGGAARDVGLEPAAVETVWERFLARPGRASAHRAWALFALISWAGAHRAAL
jgi:asparagine synthase (glutamine-hydrolysing)